MNDEQWRWVLGTLAAAWPSGIWPQGTASLAHSLLGELPYRDVQSAVVTMVREGREFCPVPGVIYSKVQEMRPSPLALPPPEPFVLSEQESQEVLVEMRRGLTPEQIGEADSLSAELRMAPPDGRMRLLQDSIARMAKAKEMAG